jgi:hypothetical protein
MKRLQLLVAVLLIAYSVTSGWAATLDEESAQTCVGWRQLTQHNKLMYVVGWLHSAAMTKVLMEVFPANDPMITRVNDFLAVSLWPKGHRVGSVVIEVVC